MPQKIAQYNTEGQREVDFINLNSFIWCFGVQKRVTDYMYLYISKMSKKKFSLYLSTLRTETSRYKLLQMYMSSCPWLTSSGFKLQ